MTWTAITKPAQGASTKKTSFADAVVDDLTHLYNLSGGSGSGAGGVLQNGSFENDVDSDGIPDGWTQTLGAGGAGAFDITTPAHGAQAYKFTTPGSVDNYLEHEDYILCSPSKFLFVDFLLKCSAASVAADIVIRWFDKDKSYVSSTTVYSEATANPTSWQRYIVGATPPATSCYCKPRLYGGVSGDATAGDVYFDGVSTYDIGSDCQIYTAAIAEESQANVTYVDHGSITLYLPNLSNALSEMELNFVAQQKMTSAGIAYQRFRIDTQYSNEGSTTSGTYVNTRYTLTYVGVGGAVTLVQQLKANDVSPTSWGKMDSNNMAIRITLK